jgi:hypothetical protein
VIGSKSIQKRIASVLTLGCALRKGTPILSFPLPKSSWLCSVLRGFPRRILV